ncbi:translocation/assembly module TamB domain-containing protein, partial [Aegicerativicinus sediminis]
MAIILLLFIILVLIFSLPAVQSLLGKYATKKINNEFGTHINVKYVHLRFNGDVELKKVFIEDFRQDTLIFVDRLRTSIISFNNIYNGDLVFGDIGIDKMTFDIHTYKGDTLSNLDVFVNRFEEDNPKKEVSTFLFSSSDVSINNGKFRIVDENNESPYILDFEKLNLNATNFVIRGPEVKARINTFNFLDRRGLQVENLRTTFAYSLSEMSFKDLDIKTEGSHLQGDLKFSYNREDFKEFTDKVAIEANFKDSQLLLDDINHFYDEFGKNEKVRLDLEASGTLNDLELNNLRLISGINTNLYGRLHLNDIFNTQNGRFSVRGNISNLSSNYYDLRDLMPGILGSALPTAFSTVGNFSMKGTTVITKTNVDADLYIVTDIGNIDSDIKLSRVNEIDNASYVGNIIFDELDLGALTGNVSLGKASFNLDVDGKGFKAENLSTKIDGEIFTLTFNNYNYHDIVVSGNVGNNVFNGTAIAEDPNLSMRFEGLADMSKKEGKFNFAANVFYADLHELNFIKNDSIAIFKGLIDCALRGSNIDDVYGTLNFSNTTYQNSKDQYFFQDFAITSVFNDRERSITINSPDIVEGYVNGSFSIYDIGKLVENSVGSIYTNFVPNKINREEYINFDFNIYNKIVEIFYPDLEIGPNTTVSGRIETDETKFELNFSSPEIKLKDYFANNINVTIDNSNPLFNTFIEIDSLNTGVYNLSEFNLINATRRDTLFIETDFKGGPNNKDTFSLSLYYTIDLDEKSVVGFKKSGLVFKGNQWFINEDKNRLNKLIFDREFKEFALQDLVFNQENEEITIFGTARDSTYKDINVAFSEVQLAKITPTIDSLSMNGIVTGNLKIFEEFGVYKPESTVNVKDLIVNGIQLGDLDANILGNESLTNYDVDITLQNDNIKSLEAVGSLDVSNTESFIDLNVRFEDFTLDPLAPLGEGVITNIRGLVSGELTVTGDLKKPSIDGELLIDNAGLTIPYLNVDYQFDFDSRITLRNQRFIFEEVELTDGEYFSRAILNGFIEHNNFSDWKLGLDIETDRLLVLNTEYTEESLYYGTAFMEGTAEIVGPTDELTINVDGTTSQGTVFKIPLNDLESYGDNTFIHFLSPEEKEARLSGQTIINTDIKGLELNFDLIVLPNADIEILIDRTSGSTIQGSGNGNLLFNINTNGRFKMYGDFIVNRGIYNFAYGGFIERKIEVEPGGTLRWEGDPLKALIDITAVYKTNANPSVLLDNPINRTIPVELEINLTGQLEQPEPNFTFEFPTVSSTVKSELEYRLDTKERRENQALFLLASGTFASEIGLGQQAYGTISDRLNSLVNSLISDADGKLQVGLNYQMGEQTAEYTTDDRVGLTLSTQISDRVRFNGKLG